MRYPDAVTILRPRGSDEYDNPGASWAAPAEISAVGFLMGDMCLMPPRTDVRAGDRLRIADRVYDVVGDPEVIRSPVRDVMIVVKVDRRRP